MGEMFSGIGVVILIALTIINLVIYHKFFSVIYFGNLGRHFIREVIVAWIVAVLEMAIFGSILMKLFGAVATVLSFVAGILMFILFCIGIIYAYKHLKKAYHYKEDEIVSENKVFRVLKRINNIITEYPKSLSLKEEILYGLSIVCVICLAGGILIEIESIFQTTKTPNSDTTEQYANADFEQKADEKSIVENDQFIKPEISSDREQTSETKYRGVLYGSYRMDLNNEDDGWCEASVYENNGSFFVDIYGYIWGDRDVVDLSGRLDSQENGVYTISDLYLYDGEQYLGEDIPDDVFVDIEFTDTYMTVEIENANGTLVSELNGRYNLIVETSEIEGKAQKTEEYVWWDDTLEIYVCLEYTGETEGYATLQRVMSDENGERTTDERKVYFSLVDESGIYGFIHPDTGEVDSMVFTIMQESDGTDEYNRMYLMDGSSLSTYYELVEKDYAYSHFS